MAISRRRIMKRGRETIRRFSYGTANKKDHISMAGQGTSRDKGVRKPRVSQEHDQALASIQKKKRVKAKE